VHTYYAIGNYTVKLTINGVATKSATINVNKLTPTVTWSNPADINDTTPLSSTQLNATASVPGNFIYNPEAGTVLNRGTHRLNAVFTPIDSANYTTASANVKINVTFSSSKIVKAYAYIPNEDSRTISVIDTATDTVVKTIPCTNIYNDRIGAWFYLRPVGVAVTPDGSKVIITGTNENAYGVLDTATETVVYAGDMARSFPYGVVISPDGTKAYISNLGDRHYSIVDLATNEGGGGTMTNWDAIPESGIAVSTDGTKVYVANRNSNNISYDIGTDFFDRPISIPVHGSPPGLAMSPDGTKL
jgi:YVTN family beta-propeller protein